MQFDVVVLTKQSLLQLNEADWYSRQVHHEDGLVMAALSARGLRAGRKAWDDPDFDWTQTRGVLFRTTWDYFDRFSEFSPWLCRVAQQTTLFNSAELINWNIDKHYLATLAKKGINTVSSHYIEKGDTRTLEQCLQDCTWEHAILKPVVSGSARHTYRLDARSSTALECTFAELIQHEAMMLQPFQQHILSQGELSLMVIDGTFSHAIRKLPQAGDFRVQDDHGGSVHSHQATAEERTFAEATVAALPFDVLYARVDIIRDNHGQLALMEGEMIEPELFFRFKPEAADKLAAGLARRLACQPD
jgi:glutathione synthase/RimK-type ligase-like ATP-grasp enzyme